MHFDIAWGFRQKEFPQEKSQCRYSNKELNSPDILSYFSKKHRIAILTDNLSPGA